MRIQSLKAIAEVAAPPTASVEPDGPAIGGAAQDCEPPLPERQALEIALLKARIQHLELVVETARSLMGSNQERLLRRLHEVPRDIAAITAQLRRVDPQGAW